MIDYKSVWGFFDIPSLPRKSIFKLANLIFAELLKLRERKRENIILEYKKSLTLLRIDNQGTFGQISRESVKSTYRVNSLEEGKSTQNYAADQWSKGSDPLTARKKNASRKLIPPHQSGCQLGYAADQWNTRFGPPESLATIIREKFSSRNLTPSNGDWGDIKDLVQGVVCFLEEFIMYAFTDSTWKKSPIPTTQTTRNSAICNVNKICKCMNLKSHWWVSYLSTLLQNRFSPISCDH